MYGLGSVEHSEHLSRTVFTLAMAWAGMSLAVPAPLASFQVHVGAGAETLLVEASFPASSAGELVLEDGGGRFLRDVEVDQAGHWVPLLHPEAGIATPECAKGCRVRYRFLLREAADALADPQAAAAFAKAFVAPPSTWLLHPREAPLAGYRLRVDAPEGLQFVTGLPPSSEPKTYQSTSGLRVAPLCAFGPWRVRQLDVNGSHIALAIAPVSFAMSDEEMERWVAEAARAVAAYYRHFPVAQLLLMVVPEGGPHLSGFTLGEGGASILLRLGKTVSAARARSHWVLVHEMMHLGFPSLRRNHLWMEEGMAVFGEPIVRVRAGLADEAVLWSEWLEQGPLGLPLAGDGGLERTHTWARTYWGGALFWLVADITLRERTGNAKSADDVLRALVAAGGNVTSRWEVEDVLRVADAATALPVFSELFHSMAEAPGAPDLGSLFGRLGVSLRDGTVVYNDSAPLAGIRRAMVGGGH